MPGEERKKAGIWPWTVTALIGLPVLYVASFGPACWLIRREVFSVAAVAHFYRPIVEYAATGPAAIRKAAEWYSGPAIQHSYRLDELFARLKSEELERQGR